KQSNHRVYLLPFNTIMPHLLIPQLAIMTSMADQPKRFLIQATINQKRPPWNTRRLRSSSVHAESVWLSVFSPAAGCAPTSRCFAAEPTTDGRMADYSWSAASGDRAVAEYGGARQVRIVLKGRAIIYYARSRQICARWYSR